MRVPRHTLRPSTDVLSPLVLIPHGPSRKRSSRGLDDEVWERGLSSTRGRALSCASEGGRKGGGGRSEGSIRMHGLQFGSIAWCVLISVSGRQPRKLVDSAQKGRYLIWTRDDIRLMPELGHRFASTLTIALTSPRIKT